MNQKETTKQGLVIFVCTSCGLECAARANATLAAVMLHCQGHRLDIVIAQAQRRKHLNNLLVDWPSQPFKVLLNKRTKHGYFVGTTDLTPSQISRARKNFDISGQENIAAIAPNSIYNKPTLEPVDLLAASMFWGAPHG